MKKYLTFLRTVLTIWMPKCIQERIEDTQMAWERLRMARYNARVKARDPFKDVFVPYNRVSGTAPDPRFIVTTTHTQPAKKKVAKKKVARKKANKPNVTITAESPSGKLTTVGADVVVNGPGDYTIKPKRIRRSKAQIEADRQAKEQQVQP